ncbi:MAG TPA: DUF4350 domain-containing protein [Terriglobales bacterium]|nr:DUF4350 domain-containing protein [Terriglobales bacterium]
MAQQVPDLDYKPPIPKPAYAQGEGPRVVIDGGHHNFHTVDGRYRPLAELLRRDGYRVAGSNTPFTASSLKAADLLIISNALNAVNADGNWGLPTPSAFTPAEIAELKKYVENGGALFLIADHMPFPGAAGDLARAFGLEFSNGFAMPRDAQNPGPITFTPEKGLKPGPWTEGRGVEERVDSVVTFTGSAFYPGPNVEPVLELPQGYVSVTPEMAWQFTPETPRVPITRWCQGAVVKVGKGRVAVFGEAAMFSAQVAGPQKRPMGMNSDSAKQNYQFLLNIVHWLTNAK